jgi:hypothetical protein
MEWCCCYVLVMQHVGHARMGLAPIHQVVLEGGCGVHKLVHKLRPILFVQSLIDPGLEGAVTVNGDGGTVSEQEM